MSIMRCPRCEKNIDTDFEDYDFDLDSCIDCLTEKECEDN